MPKSIQEHQLPNIAGDGLMRNLSIDGRADCEAIKAQALRRKSLRNVCVFSLCYFLTFSGFWALTNLQSTMNAEGGLGDYSQAVMYVTAMVSSLFLPKVLIDKFGCKKILIFGNVICCFSIASNMFLRWDLMLTASAAFGLANGPYASAQTVYIDEMATRFQSTITENLEFIMAAFFGMLMFSIENTQVWGNIISYYVLKNENSSYAGNLSMPSECGANFFPSENDANQNLDPPTEYQRFLLIGIYLGMGLLSVLIMVFFLEPLNNDIKAGSGWKTILERLVSALKFLRNPHPCLLVPLGIYIGMEGSFYANEVTQLSI
ncbi:hypothetical protein CDAR_37391 [Caerostris darwini]|uniref:Uncharacterized protein n=1 Tax=Caerostris darwini TaxID=1538125 RepID=A0AAV4TTN1_9ARAC|nr:hypothetical protein CDAR_37391 [Caerostris darwini]